MNNKIDVKKVSILGAGFIGLNLVEACLMDGYEVSIFDRKPAPEGFFDKCLWVTGKFDSIESVNNAVVGSDVVIHLISNTVPGDSVDVSKELFANVSQTLQLLNLCLQNKVKRVIFISSSSIYGPQSLLPISEDVLPRPISAHGIQKLTLEHYLQLYKNDFDLDCKILRLSNPYGRGQNIFGRQGFISILMGNIISNRITKIRGNGNAIRDYINIEDVIRAILLTITTNSKEIIFNIGSGTGNSLNDVLSEVELFIENKIKREYVATRDADIPSSILDISKAKKELKFIPKIPLRDGLRKYLKFNNLL